MAASMTRPTHTVSPVARARVRHRPYFVRMSRNGTIAMASRTGELTVLDCALRELVVRELGHELEGIAFSEARGKVAVPSERGVWLIDIRGGPDERLVEPGRVSAHFSPDGQWLWLVTPLSRDSGLLEIRDSRSETSPTRLFSRILSATRRGCCEIIQIRRAFPCGSPLVRMVFAPISSSVASQA
jgi:hypothetical protein